MEYHTTEKAENREEWLQNLQLCPNGQPDYGIDKKTVQPPHRQSHVDFGYRNWLKSGTEKVRVNGLTRKQRKTERQKGRGEWTGKRNQAVTLF